MAVKGLDRLKRQIRALAPTLAATLADPLDQNAAEAAGAIARAAPDEKLAASVAWSRDGGALSEGQQLKAQAGLARTVTAGDKEAFWAHWTEDGTAPHSLAKGADRESGKLQSQGPFHPGTDPNPFFYPTLRALRRRHRTRLTRAANKAARLAAAR